MWTFFAKPEQNSESREHNIVKDILRVIRDLIAVVNDIAHLNVLNMMIDALNEMIGEEVRPTHEI